MRSSLALDPAVPHRDRLLDVDEMRARLHGCVASGAALLPARIKYRPSQSLRVVYRISGDGPVFVTARTFPPGSLRTNASAASADFFIPELDAAFWNFPHDRRIQDIPGVLDAGPELRAHVPGWETTHVVAYTPEKSAVLACVDAARRPVAFAKVFADEIALTRTCALHRAIAAALAPVPDATIVPILAEVPARRTAFFAPARGRRIADLSHDELTPALRRVGRALARIHQSTIPRRVGAFERTTFRALHDAALLVGMVRPALKHAALLLAADLAGSRPSSDDCVLLHGDFHLKNAFVDDTRVSIIDFDQAANGAPAADIGSLLAALRGRSDALARAFLDGYASIRPLPSSASLAWHTAAALLTERAARAITRMRMDTLEELGNVIEGARDLAQDAREGR